MDEEEKRLAKIKAHRATHVKRSAQPVHAPAPVAAPVAPAPAAVTEPVAVASVAVAEPAEATA
jgi:small subunit ribosomal protein S6